MIFLMFPALIFVVVDRPFAQLWSLKPAVIVATDSPERKLLKERYSHRLAAVKQMAQPHQPFVCDWDPPRELRLLEFIPPFIEAGFALAETPAERLVWREIGASGMRHVEYRTQRELSVGNVQPQLLNLARAAGCRDRVAEIEGVDQGWEVIPPACVAGFVELFSAMRPEGPVSLSQGHRPGTWQSRQLRPEGPRYRSAALQAVGFIAPRTQPVGLG